MISGSCVGGNRVIQMALASNVGFPLITILLRILICRVIMLEQGVG